MSWKITYPVSHLSALSYNSRYCRLLSMFMIFTLKASKTRPTVCPHPHKVRPEGLLSHFGIALALSEFPLSPWLKAFTYAIKAEDLSVLSMYIQLISGWCFVFRIPLDFFLIIILFSENIVKALLLVLCNAWWTGRLAVNLPQYFNVEKPFTPTTT